MLVISALAATAPVPEPTAPTVTGQPFQKSGKYTYQYGVEWRLVRAGVARVIWSPVAGGHEGELHLESAGLVSKLYRVNDDYKSRLTHELCATSVQLASEEGKRRRETKISFDRSSGKVSYIERDLIRNSVVLAKEIQTPQCVYEYLGALHHLQDVRLEPGQSITVPVTDGKKFANVRVEAQEREEVITPLGKFNTIRYELFLFNDVLITRKARMFLWISDDARRLPVQLRVRMQFLIGTINLQLEKEEHQ